MAASAAAACGPSTATTPSLRDILERDIVGDDVFVQVMEDALARFRLGIQQEPVFEAEHVDVGLDVPLRVQEEGVASGAGGKSRHMVGGHGVQQAGAVVPGAYMRPRAERSSQAAVVRKASYPEGMFPLLSPAWRGFYLPHAPFPTTGWLDLPTVRWCSAGRTLRTVTTAG